MGNSQMLFAKIIIAEQKDDSLNMGSKHLLSFMYLYFQHPVEQGNLLLTYFPVGTRNQKGCGVDSGEKAGVWTLHDPVQAHPNCLPNEQGSPVSSFVQSFDSGMN